MNRGAIPIAAALAGGTAAAAIGLAVAAAQTVPSVDDLPTTAFAALTAANSALLGYVAWLTKRLLSGDWVRVDQAALLKTLEAAAGALEKSAQREERLMTWLEHAAQGRRRPPSDD